MTAKLQFDDRRMALILERDHNHGEVSVGRPNKTTFWYGRVDDRRGGGGTRGWLLSDGFRPAGALFGSDRCSVFCRRLDGLIVERRVAVLVYSAHRQTCQASR
jgi:hypothetical protein